MRRGDQIQIKDFFSERNNDYKCKEPFECAGAGIKYNDEIEFVCEGEDEEEALAGIVLVIQNGLGDNRKRVNSYGPFG
jgi:Phosphotransferase system, HPr-related proteins